LNAANANVPKGHFSDADHTWEVGANDQIFKAKDYRPLIVAYSNGAPVRVSDVAEVVDSVEDIRNAGYANGSPSVLVTINRQPGANIIDTVDHIREAMPQIKAAIPQSIDLHVTQDQTVTIRASVHDVEITLMISVLLVVLVVFVFLRNVRTTLIPSVAVPVSLIGTFGVMYLFGYSLDNLSLMALTIATGFVVDDAIVVIENITRYLEAGMKPMQAALHGAQEIGFTVLTISISLVAVFIPLLMMGGIVGRLFREFSVVLSVAIFVSMLVSLTTTPMMCAHLLKEHETHGRLFEASERVFKAIINAYGRTLARVLRHPVITLLVLAATIGLNVYLFVRVPKGFFPQQDNGRMQGTILGDQDTSFQQMQNILLQMVKILQEDPAMDTVTASTGGSGGGGSTINQGRVNIQLKPLAQRKGSVYQVIERLRPRLATVRGATLILQASQDVRVGGRSSAALYQFTMRGDNLQDLVTYGRPMLEAVRKVSILRDVNTDQQINGLQAVVHYDRDTAARFAISSQLIDNVLYDAFGQRQVSTMYTSLNQYHVVMEVAPTLSEYPESYRMVYAGTASNTALAPLPVLAQYKPSTMLLSVAHQGQYPSVTISFNLKDGMSLGPAVDEIEQALREMVLPAEIHGGFAGTAQAFQSSTATYIILVLAALMAVYIVLGILYESYIHPLTIISTLPSAGMGALLALRLWGTELNVIGLIGIILLIGIVKKNAILMIDFALDAERKEGKPPEEAILQACLLRFRPIMMTTMTALLGGLPLVLGTGLGSELRRPLGITIIGGLIVSQALTLFTTPVVYLYADRIRLWSRAKMGVKRREVIAEGNEA
jgi:multidrug efflux pump